MKTLRIPLALAAVLCAGAAPAQATKPGQNGGMVATADGHPVELVTNVRELTFYIQDEDGKLMDTKGMSARAIVQDGGKTATVPLSSTPPNRFVGPLATPLGTGAKIVFSTRAHGHSLQARFEIK